MAVPGVLTIMPEDGLQVVTLQCNPAALTMTTSNASNNIRGIDNIITFVGSENNNDTGISFSAYFTALDPFNSVSSSVAKNAGIGIAATVAVGLSTPEVLNVVNAAVSTIGLANGYIDLVGGIIKGHALPASPVSLTSERFDRIEVLHQAMKQSTPCRINWDMENALFRDQRYIIRQINCSVQRMQHSQTDLGADLSPANTLEVQLDVDMIKVGTRVILT